MAPSLRNASTEIRINVADAIIAIDKTLRAGRYAALRSPSRETGSQPRPSIDLRGGRPNQKARKHRHAASKAVPPPKNAPLLSRIPAAAPTISAAPRPAKLTAAMKVRLRLPLSAKLSTANWPASRLRSETFRRLLRVNQMQPIAATMPPMAPPARDAADTCSVSAVVPTAPTHHVPNALTIRDA